MQKKTTIIIVSVLAAAVVATGLGVLIWWLLWEDEEVTVIELDGDGIGTARYTAAFTRIPNVGNIFWWFYPTTAAAAATKPLLLWLDGVTGVPPSLLANLLMVGPYDQNLNARADSWIDEFNLLFVDAPIGTGFSFSTQENLHPTNLEENAEHLFHTVSSFYKLHDDYRTTPLYIVGQGSGAQLALQLAIRLNEENEYQNNFSNIRGVVLGNGVISPTLALTKLGFYLEEMGYIDYVGRAAVESFSTNISSMVNGQRYADAFDKFINLGDYVNEDAETVAVNLGHIVEKLTKTSTAKSTAPDCFGQQTYLRSLFPQDLYSIMDEVVSSALGISSSDVKYDANRQQAVQAVRETFMIPAVDKVEYILQNTNLHVSIFNGNLDAVSSTPGQLEWVNNLQWYGQQDFLNSTRQTLVVNRLVEGYFRETTRLVFYWMNAAGHWVPLDSPVAMRRVIQRITEES